MPSEQYPLFADLPQWTYSQLKLLNRCPLEFKVRYVDNLKELFKPVGMDTWVGNLLHQVIGDYYRTFRVTEDILSRLMEIYEKRRPLKEEWKNERFGEERTLYALEAFSRSRLATQTPEAVELACKGVVGRTIIRGKIDLICYDSADDSQLSLVEFKLDDVEVSGSKPEQSHLQTLLYYHALPKHYQERISRFCVYIFELGQSLLIEKTEDLLAAAIQSVERLVTLAEGPEFPARLNPFCGSCGYRFSCSEYQNSNRKR